MPAKKTEIAKNDKKPEASAKEMITVHIMNKAYKVPFGLTIMEAIEYTGFRFIRGSGCRAGFCGACATVYRKENDYRLYTALACQTSAEDGMYLAQIPFTPANRALYKIEELKPEANTMLSLYPVIAKCVSCNTCTRACPQELQVMDYVQAALRGDIARVSELSFDCIQCGLCAMRCPAEIPQYHVGQLGRRLYGKHLTKKHPQLAKRVEEIVNGEFNPTFDQYLKMTKDELTNIYKEQQKTRELGD